jgi:hypothetical protein
MFMVALAVALGFTLWRIAAGIGHTIATLLNDEALAYDALTWDIGGRVLTLGELLRGLIEFTVVGLVALLILRRERMSPTP